MTKKTATPTIEGLELTKEQRVILAQLEADVTTAASILVLDRLEDVAVRMSRAHGWCDTFRTYAVRTLGTPRSEPVKWYSNATRGRREFRDSDGRDCHGASFDGYALDTSTQVEYHTQTGLDREGYDRAGFHPLTGLNRDGFDAYGFNTDGIDAAGNTKYRFSPDGYDADGFSHQGFDRNGYDRDGYGSNGRNRDGLDREGYDRRGYDADGYNRQGLNPDGIDREGMDRYGLSPFRFGPGGWDNDGYGADGYHRDNGTRRPTLAQRLEAEAHLAAADALAAS